jgi:hypothetical protein
VVPHPIGKIAARSVEGHGYEVADLEVFNVAPDFDDFARDLMT